MPRLAQRLDGEATFWLLPACQLPINAKLESKNFPNALNASNAGLCWNGDFFFPDADIQHWQSIVCISPI